MTWLDLFTVAVTTLTSVSLTIAISPPVGRAVREAASFVGLAFLALVAAVFYVLLSPVMALAHAIDRQKRRR